MGLALQPVEQPARRMLFLARHIEARQASDADPRAFRPGRSGLGIVGRVFDPHHAAPAHAAREAEHMRVAAQRHDGAVGERHRFRQAGDAFLQPIEMARQEFVGIGEARIKRHGEHGAAARFAHLQAEPSRPRTPSQHHGNIEAADLDLDGLAAREVQTLQHWYAPYCRRCPRFGGRQSSTGSWGSARPCFRQTVRRPAPARLFGAGGWL